MTMSKYMFAKKILILGHGRHGKDTLAEVFKKEYGISAMSSSEAANKIFMFQDLKDQFNYNTYEECHRDRLNHRDLWYNKICEYNKEDKSRLAKNILIECDCYVGMRDIEELNECKRQKLFDIIIWVDASKRLPEESSTSMNITKDDADIIIENNSSEEEFIIRSKKLGKLIYG